MTAEDRLDVIEACHRLTWALDQDEWTGVRGRLGEPIVCDLSDLTGEPPTTLSRADFEGLLSSWHAPGSVTQHLVGNQIVDFTDENRRATVRMYVEYT